MTDIKIEWLIADLTETEIRGTDDVPIYVSEPWWALHEVIYPNFTSIVYSGKKRLTHSFRSDDIETALDVINDGGEENEISKALATNISYCLPLLKHCKKLEAKAKKAKKVIVKKSSSKKTKSYSKTEITDTFKVDLNKDTTITLKNWM